MRYLLPGILALAVVLVLASCSSSATTSSSSPATTTTSATTPSSTATFAQSAQSGKAVFASRCSKCHGDNGQGVTAPALIGSGANLAKYNTSQGLLTFYQTTMPFDAPGSLSSQDYLNILAYLMVQNSYLSGSAPYDSSALLNVQLKK
jgi:mono/diheme cytochrome c family protein